MTTKTPFSNFSKGLGFIGKAVESVKEECEDKKSKKYLPELRAIKRPMPAVDSFITSMGVRCHNDTGKFWLVAESVCWDDNECKWVCSEDAVMPVPMMIKASAEDAEEDDEFTYMPSFDGFIEVYTTSSDEPVKLYGMSKVPKDMIGAIYCIGDQPPCYLGYPKPLAIPVEIQIGGEMPATGSEVKVWYDQGIPKTLGADGWVQILNYKG